jgi:putative DNA primase/helicase
MSAAETLTSRLGGKWHHAGYGEARCPIHDDHDPSLTIRNGERAPLVTCFLGCERRQIVTALRQAGHWPEPEPTDGQARGSTSDERQRRAHETYRYLLSVWRAALPITDTPAETYLREERGIRGELPPTLRYAVLKHTDTGLMLPAMIAAVQAPDRSICGIHRTYLRADGTGKAPVTKPRKMLGRYMTGAIRFAAAAPEMAIGEGIETTLSYMQATGVPSWAAICTSGMRAIVPPPLPMAAVVHLLVDLDAAGEEAAEAAAARLDREGRKVKLARPIVGKDFNDALREGRNAR